MGADSIFVWISRIRDKYLKFNHSFNFEKTTIKLKIQLHQNVVRMSFIKCFKSTGEAVTCK